MEDWINIDEKDTCEEKISRIKKYINECSKHLKSYEESINLANDVRNNIEKFSLQEKMLFIDELLKNDNELNLYFFKTKVYSHS